jgi:putative restriction endonuclease
MDRAADQAIRVAAFAFLDEQRSRHGDALPWSTLLKGLTFDGRRVPLISQQGIFKPAILDLPLSIRTTAPEEGKPPPYEDGMGPDGLLRYRYRGTDPGHYQNEWLRRAMQEQAQASILGRDPARE